MLDQTSNIFPAIKCAQKIYGKTEPLAGALQHKVVGKKNIYSEKEMGSKREKKLINDKTFRLLNVFFLGAHFFSLWLFWFEESRFVVCLKYRLTFSTGNSMHKFHICLRNRFQTSSAFKWLKESNVYHAKPNHPNTTRK